MPRPLVICRRLGRRSHDEANAELAELLVAHGAGRAGHELDGLLGLGEGDDLADGVVSPQHEHDETVEAEGDTAVGRGTDSLKAVEQVTRTSRFCLVVR